MHHKKQGLALGKSGSILGGMRHLVAIGAIAEKEVIQ